MYDIMYIYIRYTKPHTLHIRLLSPAHPCLFQCSGTISAHRPQTHGPTTNTGGSPVGPITQFHRTHRTAIERDRIDPATSVPKS